MSDNPQSFIPALNFHILTPLYSPCARLLFGKTFEKIVQTIPFNNNQKVLDVGCGPGIVLNLISKRDPSLIITGIDIDPAILEIAGKKLHLKRSNSASEIEWINNQESLTLVQASASKLPFQDEQFDIVVSSLMFHHLKPEEKHKAVSEIYRILKKGQTAWIFDFARPTTLFGKILAAFYRNLEEIDDQIEDKLLFLLKEAGFSQITTHWSAYGVISLISAKK